MSDQEAVPICTVVGVKQTYEGWRVFLIYADGEIFLSRATYPSQQEAERAAQLWALANHVDEGKPN